MMIKYAEKIVWVLFAVLTLFLTFNRHGRSGDNNYHTETWADRGGYYVYLPACFKYDFNPAKFPDSIDHKTGDGFILDFENNRVVSKYTSGVAILQMPFYLIADVLAKPLKFKSDGFSRIYRRFIDVASVFYLLLGLVLLSRFMRTNYSNSTRRIVLSLLFFATNLFYYSIDDTGMSHVYSFSMFCVFLFLIQKTQYLLKISLLNSVLLGFVCGMIILIRPTNILFLLTYFFLDIENKNEIIERLKRIFNPRFIFVFLLFILLVLLPQISYWKFTYGVFLKYSYTNEGFNWLSPMLFNTWFSPFNGLFLYTPFYLIILLSMLLMVFHKVRNGYFVLILFGLISYVFASWWDWTFGCSFGARSFVEFLALFSIPLAYIVERIKSKNIFIKYGFWIIVFASIVYNLKMTYSYDECFYGAHAWDWQAYFDLLLKKTN